MTKAAGLPAKRANVHNRVRTCLTLRKVGEFVTKIETRQRSFKPAGLLSTVFKFASAAASLLKAT
jgi:hypothetical protein